MPTLNGMIHAIKCPYLNASIITGHSCKTAPARDADFAGLSPH
jgi:hypothetical protein